MPGTPSKGIPGHIMDAFKKAFGFGGTHAPDQMDQHYNRMKQEDPEDMGGVHTMPQGLKTPSGAGTEEVGPHASSALHPKLQMLMSKLSPSQEEEPEEESQFSPSRLSSGMS